MAIDATAAAAELDQAATDNTLSSAVNNAAPVVELPVREDQVANAVAFLSNPKVRNT